MSVHVELGAEFGCKVLMTGEGTQKGKDLCFICITDSWKKTMLSIIDQKAHKKLCDSDSFNPSLSVTW